MAPVSRLKGKVLQLSIDNIAAHPSVARRAVAVHTFIRARIAATILDAFGSAAIGCFPHRTALTHYGASNAELTELTWLAREDVGRVVASTTRGASGLAHVRLVLAGQTREALAGTWGWVE